jgi:hypothetical protein
VLVVDRKCRSHADDRATENPHKEKAIFDVASSRPHFQRVERNLLPVARDYALARK